MVDKKRYIIAENLKDALGILAIAIAFVVNGYIGLRNVLWSGEIAGSDSLLFLIAAGCFLIVLLITAYE
ncbi:hypothetical protein [Halocatena halophila]|uniref:hypothetical protein n=1 Tax=Halocatena halophila TaxID=2814576 RepID=UPI002ED5CD65